MGMSFNFEQEWSVGYVLVKVYLIFRLTLSNFISKIFYLDVLLEYWNLIRFHEFILCLHD